MRHIHILVPTYGRPRELKRFCASALATCNRHDWTIYALVEKDDPKLVEYWCEYNDVRGLGNIVLNVMQSKGSKNCVTEQWKSMSLPAGDIVFLVGDDLMFASFGWDEAIFKYMPESGLGLCYCEDNETREPIHIMLGVGLINIVGNVMCPAINHYYGDSWWRKIGLDADVAHLVKEMFVFHLHSKVKWKQLRATVTDAYKKNNDDLAADKRAFVASYPEIEKIVQRIKQAKIDWARTHETK